MNRPKGIAPTTGKQEKEGVMDPSPQGKALLIATITLDAEAEEAKILQEAAERASQREQYTDKKIELMLAEARQKAAQQGDALRSKAVSQAELEIRHRQLQARNEVIRQIMSKVEQKLKSMIGTDSYREILARWIEEAAKGLDVDAAMLNASAEERSLIDESLIHEVQARVERSRGKPVTIRVDEGQALLSPGIVLTANNGRMAYNNQVKTRLLRRQQDIQRLIHDRLFAEEQ